MRKAVAWGAASLGLLGAFSITPVASAAHRLPNSCTENWTRSSGEGVASGKWCDNYTRVTGTVKDTKSDGRCPFVRGHLNNGRHVDSEWAGPKGDTSPVNLSSPTGTYFSDLSMQYINC
ncbi:hypothetical protein [Streptomyces palmae]|uniref:Secreted protein n=1 Tax=Streptomyces palmae TaxID=1701085 RepID=A0A4Z0GYK0_9ACTN|nr:hypothetical protein [Streptomyces palmae]TGB02568.1 hypothetical protein E4099_20515 [Streptomyces palmae]